MRSFEIDVRGTKITYLDAGSGPPLLWLHGIDGAAADPLVTALAATRRVIVPELPGFGQSRLPEWLMSTGDMAYFCFDLAAALGLDRYDLVGHSIGGWIACEMAIRSTAKLDSLTLIAPAGVVPTPRPADDIFLLSGDDAIRAQFHDQAVADREVAARAGQEIDIALQNRTGLARLAWTPRMASVQLPHWLHRIDVPTLIVWGEEDRIVPFACHATFVREIPRAELVRFAACGHAVPIERGAETAQRMISFLSGARR
jgi:pimeloyl-ACP methyl ester carboxylesterase